MTTPTLPPEIAAVMEDNRLNQLHRNQRVADALEQADERNPPNAKTQAAIAFQLSRIADALEILAKGTQP